MKQIPVYTECAALFRRSKARLWASAFLAIACLISLAPQTAFAQASAGITGTVTDPSGAVVPNAKVTITNEQTSSSSDTTSSSAGSYSFRGLLPGKYDLQVDAAGFKKDVKKGVTIEVSTTSTVDFALTTGAASETVQVTADEIALNTTAPELGSTIEPAVVAALPEQVSGRGRQIDQLQFLAPGTTGRQLLSPRQRWRRLRTGNHLQRHSGSAVGDRRLHHELQSALRSGAGIQG